MTNLSKLSVYWRPTHKRGGDIDYIRQLRPYDVLILDPDVQEISNAHQASPESQVVIRSWPLDDGRTDQNPHGCYRDLLNDPEGLAVRHADEYGAMAARFEREARERKLPFPAREQLAVHLVNEPDTNTHLPAINKYTEVACYRLRREYSLTAEALNLSTGHPAWLKDGIAGGVPDWKPLEGALEAILVGGHYAVTHEYFNDLGLRHESLNPWHIGRLKYAAERDATLKAAVQAGLKLKIGEFGIEMLLNGRMAQHHGWQGKLSPAQMIADTEWYLRSEIPANVVSTRIFMTDYVDGKWRTFDTEPIHGELVRIGRKHLSAKPSVHIPTVTTGPTTFMPYTVYIASRNGLNIRQGPGTDHPIVSAIPYRHAVQIIGKDGVWLRTSAGWIHSSFVSTTQPAELEPAPVEPVQPGPPTQPQQQSGIIDPLAGQAIIAIESGGQAFGPGGRLLIRFENHLFNRHTNNAHANLFRQGNPPWTGHEWQNQFGVWQKVHTGNQNDEYAVFDFASTLNRNAALQSISMGLGQILGSHYRRLGYASAESMFVAFGDRRYGYATQMLGFLNFFLSDTRLFQAMRNKDFLTVATIYNGPGQAQHYANLMAAEYRRLGGAG